MKRNLWIGLGSVGILLAGSVAFITTRPKDEIKWRQAKVEKGNVTQRINATGTINALVQVPVGTQVSGVVTALYADYNSLVKKGQVIARIDPTVWEAQLKDTEASLQRAQATFDNAKSEFERNKRLALQKLVSDQDLDSKETVMKTAKGNLESAKASLVRSKINLSYCTITAPVDGVVVSRVVDVGQTVAASFSTPNLFTIAQDLSKMKVETFIDEADIGLVKAGQRTFFTVDSYPDKQFVGSVSEVRLEPIVNQNVVTYKVVMEVTNEPRNADAVKLPGEGERGHGRAEGGEHQGPPDFDAMWERRKDRVPQGTTKEDFIKRIKERMAEGGGKMGSHIASQPAPQPVIQSTSGQSSTARYIQPGSPVYKGDLALLPGMTANVSIIANSRKDVLRVPSVALRFNASAFLKDDSKAEAKGPGGPGQGGGQRMAGQGGLPAKGMVARREDRVWILEKGKPKAITVKAGVNDGQFTELLGTELPEGTVILTGVDDNKKMAAAQGATPIGGGGRH